MSEKPKVKRKLYEGISFGSQLMNFAASGYPTIFTRPVSEAKRTKRANKIAKAWGN